MKAIIIDDEKLFRSSLKAMLSENCPNIEVVAEADSVESGLKCILETEFDILFLDVILKDGTGFDILLKLKASQLKFKIIFTTADDDYAIKALKINADYLLKPLGVDELKEAIQKVSISTVNELKPLSVDKPNEPIPESKKLALATAERIQIFSIDDLIRCESVNNYTFFHFKNHPKLLITRTLKDFEDLLTKHNFIRVHRSHLVKMDHLLSFERQKGNYMIMNDGTEIPVSKRKKETVLDFIAGFLF